MTTVKYSSAARPQSELKEIIYCEQNEHTDSLRKPSEGRQYGFAGGGICQRCLAETPCRSRVCTRLVGAATLPELFDSILAQYQLCLNFFKLEDAGRVLVRGVNDKGDIKNTNVLNEAFELGQQI